MFELEILYLILMKLTLILAEGYGWSQQVEQHQARQGCQRRPEGQAEQGDGQQET